MYYIKCLGRSTYRKCFYVTLNLRVRMETLRGLAVSSISRIGRILGQRLGIPPPESSRHLFQRCAICVWRGNATLWLNRFSSSPPPPIILCLCLLFVSFLLFFVVFCLLCVFFRFLRPFFLNKNICMSLHGT